MTSSKSQKYPRQAEIGSFHNAHFSSAATALFDTQFFQPGTAQQDDQYYEEEYEEFYEEEDDGLGWYEDGVKRTLTDEQIAIFRHSELEGLRRAEAKVAKTKQESAALLQEAKDEDAAKLSADPITSLSTPSYDESAADGEIKEEGGEVQDGSEDGEIEEEEPQLTKAEARRLKKQRTKRRKQEQRKFNPEKKPDLRKRTWDVVEAGMDSLYYDEEGAEDAAAAPAAQRRRISYDD